MPRLEDKIALVTGASEGIGYAIAERFIAEGAHVYITGRRQDKLDDAAHALGPNAHPVRADSADLGDLDTVFATIERGNGILDIVVANAGMVESATIEEATPEHYDRVMGINARGAFFTVQKAIPLMTRGGSVILMSSMMKDRGFPGISVYSATKAVLRSFARNWTNELKDRDIRVNTISPGAVSTPALRGQGGGTDEGLAAVEGMFSGMTPMGRTGRGSEIAAAAVFLASDDGSYSAGSDIVVDGGLSAV